MRLGMDDVTLLRGGNEQLTGLTVDSTEKSVNAGGNVALVFGRIGRSIPQPKLRSEKSLQVALDSSPHHFFLSYTHTHLPDNSIGTTKIGLKNETNNDMMRM
jgi:hypothetical protein